MIGCYKLTMGFSNFCKYFITRFKFPILFCVEIPFIVWFLLLKSRQGSYDFTMTILIVNDPIYL